jgi:hypothetical protein
MSVLDDFERMRLYRKQAAEFNLMADNASATSEQRRYRSIARHYSELADREQQADKARMLDRLQQLRRKREATRTGLPLLPVNDNFSAGTFSGANQTAPLNSNFVPDGGPGSSSK